MQPKFDDTHIEISEKDAIERFRPEQMVCEPSLKVSKTKITQTRWQIRLPNTPLCVILSKKYEDLCWWNGEYWVYITTLLR